MPCRRRAFRVRRPISCRWRWCGSPSSTGWASSAATAGRPSAATRRSSPPTAPTRSAKDCTVTMDGAITIGRVNQQFGVIADRGRKIVTTRTERGKPWCSTYERDRVARRTQAVRRRVIDHAAGRGASFRARRLRRCEECPHGVVHSFVAAGCSAAPLASCRRAAASWLARHVAGPSWPMPGRARSAKTWLVARAVSPAGVLVWTGDRDVGHDAAGRRNVAGMHGRCHAAVRAAGGGGMRESSLMSNTPGAKAKRVVDRRLDRAERHLARHVRRLARAICAILRPAGSGCRSAFC